MSDNATPPIYVFGFQEGGKAQFVNAMLHYLPITPLDCENDKVAIRYRVEHTRSAVKNHIQVEIKDGAQPLRPELKDVQKLLDQSLRKRRAELTSDEIAVTLQTDYQTACDVEIVDVPGLDADSGRNSEMLNKINRVYIKQARERNGVIVVVMKANNQAGNQPNLFRDPYLALNKEDIKRLRIVLVNHLVTSMAPTIGTISQYANWFFNQSPVKAPHFYVNLPQHNEPFNAGDSVVERVSRFYAEEDARNHEVVVAFDSVRTKWRTHPKLQDEPIPCLNINSMRVQIMEAVLLAADDAFARTKNALLQRRTVVSESLSRETIDSSMPATNTLTNCIDEINIEFQHLSSGVSSFVAAASVALAEEDHLKTKRRTLAEDVADALRNLPHYLEERFARERGEFRAPIAHPRNDMNQDSDEEHVPQDQQQQQQQQQQHEVPYDDGVYTPVEPIDRFKASSDRIREFQHLVRALLKSTLKYGDAKIHRLPLRFTRLKALLAAAVTYQTAVPLDLDDYLSMAPELEQGAQSSHLGAAITKAATTTLRNALLLPITFFCTAMKEAYMAQVDLALSNVTRFSDIEYKELLQRNRQRHFIRAKFEEQFDEHVESFKTATEDLVLSMKTLNELPDHVFSLKREQHALRRDIEFASVSKLRNEGKSRVDKVRLLIHPAERFDFIQYSVPRAIGARRIVRCVVESVLEDTMHYEQGNMPDEYRTNCRPDNSTLERTLTLQCCKFKKAKKPAGPPADPTRRAGVPIRSSPEFEVDEWKPRRPMVFIFSSVKERDDARKALSASVAVRTNPDVPADSEEPMGARREAVRSEMRQFVPAQLRTRSSQELLYRLNALYLMHFEVRRELLAMMAPGIASRCFDRCLVADQRSEYYDELKGRLGCYMSEQEICETYMLTTSVANVDTIETSRAELQSIEESLSRLHQSYSRLEAEKGDIMYRCGQGLVERRMAAAHQPAAAAPAPAPTPRHPVQDYGFDILPACDNVELIQAIHTAELQFEQTEALGASGFLAQLRAAANTPQFLALVPSVCEYLTRPGDPSVPSSDVMQEQDVNQVLCAAAIALKSPIAVFSVADVPKVFDGGSIQPIPWTGDLPPIIRSGVFPSVHGYRPVVRR
eukprot:TRINITY_DN6659_c0_g1_i2.p1 TRINITY_DN6659_c0_g1~~TRINITY_DN6659_c0_g1_i2.p1  ORF type:complete len:1118 (-),score=207.33 TRINITY_DN6659_c0_g1_i2:14-3367(-)